jgi:hypothetical protein
MTNGAPNNAAQGFDRISARQSASRSLFGQDFCCRQSVVGQPMICVDKGPAKLLAGHAIAFTIEPAAYQGFVLT